MSHLEELLEKASTGKATASEILELTTYLEEAEKAKQQKEDLKKDFSTTDKKPYKRTKGP